MIKIDSKSHDNIIGLKVDGKLLKDDYKTVIPQLEQIISEHGAFRCLIEITGLKGGELGAFWEEIKFDTKHYKQIEQCAIVGDPSWHQWMTKLSKLIFLKAKIEHFEPDQIDQAWKWIEQDTPKSEKETEKQDEQQTETVGSSSSCGCKH
jgi:hypothetical protein